MAIGWIRAYAQENKSLKDEGKDYWDKSARAKFREKFSTPLQDRASGTADKLATLRWGDVIELPFGIGSGLWTSVEHKTKRGFVKTAHLIEVGHVKRTSNSMTSKTFVKNLKTRSGNKQLLWGDLVQILSRGDTQHKVRVRGSIGTMNSEDVGSQALLETYFVDVGQGDGVLVITPDGKHMVIDGGLERAKQQTGKNAADFVDWKFFSDYGDYRIRLDSMMASHSDSDHYGGLHDLVRKTKLADRELDCTGADIKTFHHPGLSRWKKITDADPAHSDGLGPKLNKGFVRLLGNRTDAESATNGTAPEQLGGYWGDFISDVLDNSSKTAVKPVTVSLSNVKGGKKPPLLWPAAQGCEVQVLAPVTYGESGQTALLDFGNKGKNTNGHSICLRLKYGKARILLTGDLNTKSMNWLEKSYDDRMGLFQSDVAKACHHGSEDISYRFLEAINAGATVISSGDAEGYSHPRPEIAAASACTGHIHIDRVKDKLVTPLLYMTEIERSVTLGAINRIDIKGLESDGESHDGVILGRPVDELSQKGFLSPSTRSEIDDLDESERSRALRANRRDQEPKLLAVEEATRTKEIRADLNLDVPLGPVNKKNVSVTGWRQRLMQKAHYGLVNVRTDGEIIMCATLNETESGWTVHTFPARFNDI